MSRAIVLAALLALSCGGVARVSSSPVGVGFGESWTAERCQDLLDQRDGLMWAVAFGGGLSGVGGLSTAFPDDDRARLGLGISSAVIAAATSSLAVLVKARSGEFERWCNLEPAAAAEPELEPDPEPAAELEAPAVDAGL